MEKLIITVNQTREKTTVTWEVSTQLSWEFPRKGEFSLSSTNMHCAHDVLCTNAEDAEKICSLVSWYNKTWDNCCDPTTIKFQVYGMDIDEYTRRYSQDIIGDVYTNVQMGHLKNWHYCFFREEIPRD